jgi:hypothetical protein
MWGHVAFALSLTAILLVSECEGLTIVAVGRIPYQCSSHLVRPAPLHTTTEGSSESIIPENNRKRKQQVCMFVPRGPLNGDLDSSFLDWKAHASGSYLAQVSWSWQLLTISWAIILAEAWQSVMMISAPRSHPCSKKLWLSPKVS